MTADAESELYFWGTTTNSFDKMDKMTEIDDGGYFKNCFYPDRRSYAVYMKEDTIKAGSEWNNWSNYIYLVAPAETTMRIVFEKGISEEEAETAVTDVYHSLCDTVQTDAGFGYQTARIGTFRISAHPIYEETTVDVQYIGPMAEKYEKCTDELAQTFMTELDKQGLITAFYDWNNLYDYDTAIGNFTKLYLPEDSSVSLEEVNNYLDKNYHELGLSLNEEGSLSSEKDISNIDYFKAFVGLYSDFGYNFNWGSPVSSGGSLVGTNALEAAEEEKPVVAEEEKPVVTVKNGDVNNDDAVDSKDATAVLIAYAGALNDDKVLKADDFPGGDFNGDGSVDSLDATEILIDYAEYLISLP
jgi:hypothetical protein